MPMPRDFATESLSHDPIHGYIPFVSKSALPAGEVAEQELIDTRDALIESRTAETLAMVNIYRALAGAPGDATPIASAND